MERHGIEWEQKGTHEEHLSVLDFKKQERSKEVAALEAAKQECQTDLTEMQEQLETAQTAVEAAEQRVQKAELIAVSFALMALTSFRSKSGCFGVKPSSCLSAQPTCTG